MVAPSGGRFKDKSTVSASRAIDAIRTWINQGVGIHSSISISLPVARRKPGEPGSFLISEFWGAMNVSAMSLPTSYGEVIKKITYSSAAAILLISALMLSYGMDLSPGFF